MGFCLFGYEVMVGYDNDDCTLTGTGLGFGWGLEGRMVLEWLCGYEHVFLPLSLSLLPLQQRPPYPPKNGDMHTRPSYSLSFP